jgi:multisubunit Na+/H+ antiporter MnhB subunit
VRRGDNVIFAVVSRWVTPLLGLVSFSLLASFPAGSGVGFVAGLVFSLALVANTLIWGVASARRAAPSPLLQAAIGVGLALAFAGAAAPSLRASAMMTEAGAFLVTGAGLHLALFTVLGRAPVLRETGSP